MSLRGGVSSAVEFTGLRRRHVAAFRLRTERALLSRFARPAPEPRARILCYHGVGTPSWGVNDVSPVRFRQQLELARSLGYRFVSLEEAVNHPRPGTLAITFDDGLRSVASNAAPILRELGVPYSIFAVADWLGGKHHFGDGICMTWDDLRELASAGASVGSHGVSHPDFGKLSEPQIVRELVDSAEAIAVRLGRRPDAFAIPFGGPTNWSETAAAAAAQAGYRIVLAQCERLRPAGTVARTFIASSDGEAAFRAALAGAFDEWAEWW